MFKPARDETQLVKTKSRNGIAIYTQKNPDFRAKSDHVYALYAINKKGEPEMQCVPTEEVETHLASLKLFKYADAVAICKGDVAVEEYAKERGYLKEEKKKAEKKQPEAEQAA